MGFRALIVAAALAAGVVGSGASARAAEEAATWSFGVQNATVPGAVEATGGKIVVDLSALPKGAEVFRAVLRCSRDRIPGRQREADAAVVAAADSPDKPLPLLAPRYVSFDATAPVAAAVKGGAGKVEFAVKSLSGLKPATVRLDVSFTGGKAKGAIPKVADLRARHANGQTLLTWKEPDPPTTATELTFKEWRELQASLSKDAKGVTFRIYRGGSAITPGTIAKAELVDEVGPLTCWNPDYYGVYPDGASKLPRYVVEDGKEPVPPGTGIYAHNPPAAGKAFYFVSVAVNGEEDLTAMDKASALSEAADEKVGPGNPVLQRIEKPDKFFYTDGVTLHFYVRWEGGLQPQDAAVGASAPPRCNMPSRPYDYVVILGPKLATPAPLNLVLHCWGSNFLGKGGAYTWHNWKDKTTGIGVAGNQIPYDWWTCYHENSGTWKAWTEGVTRDFTPNRLNAFVDWVMTRYEVDKTRLCVSGESMGGSGSTFAPIRYGDRYAYAYSAVGIHSPAAIKPSGFYESYANNCGELEAGLKHESGLPAWDYLNDPLMVRRNPKANLPFIGFGNGKNDGGIGWAHVVDLAKALQEARQPHAVIWRMYGHGSGSWYPADIDFRSDQSLPAFTRCSLDDDIGTATRLPQPKEFINRERQKLQDVYDGTSEGQINTHLRWKTADITDQQKEYAVTVFLTPNAPKDECTVDITPRRVQKFQVAPGRKFKWTAGAVEGGRQPQAGEATADANGLVTLEKVAVTKAGVRVRIVPAE